MKFMKAMVLACSLVVGVSASANSLVDVVTRVAVDGVLSEVTAQGLNLKEGDSANYNLNMSIMKGDMVISVEKIQADGNVWVRQDVNLMGQKQLVQILLNPNTGEILKLLVNGKEQEPPKPGNIEIVESKEDTITVPAGTFTCVYFKATDKTNNQNTEQWVNMKQVPVFGMVKSVSDSQFGPVTIELTSFKKM